MQDNMQKILHCVYSAYSAYCNMQHMQNMSKKMLHYAKKYDQYAIYYVNELFFDFF